MPQGYDVRPTYDTEGRIESWSKVPNTRFVAPSLKEMAEMDSAALANALTIGNVGYEKDLDTGKISFTGTEYDDIGSKIFDTKPTEIPINFKEGGRVGFQGGGRDASQFDFDPGPGEISSDAGFANTGKSLATQEIKEAPQVFDIGTVGDPSQNPGSINVGGGIDYTPSFDQPTFFEQALGTGQKIINNPFVRAGILKFLPPQFQTIGQFITLANSLKTAKNIYDETVKQSIDESLKTSFVDGLNINEKLLEKEAEGEFGVGGPKPIDTESIVTKKLKGLIPEGTDLRTEAEKEADYFTNLKENYFPNRELFNRFMMMDPDPKVEKDLLNLKNLDVQLTYPDQKVLNEEGF